MADSVAICGGGMCTEEGENGVSFPCFEGDRIVAPPFGLLLCLTR